MQKIFPPARGGIEGGMRYRNYLSRHALKHPAIFCLTMKKLKIPIIAIALVLIIQGVPYAGDTGRTGFAVASDASVFLLVPSSEKKIHHFKSSGVLIGKFGEEGAVEGQLLMPVDMAIYKNKLYILDLFGPQIKVFSLSGKPLDEFGRDFPKDQKLVKPLMMRIRYSKTGEKDILYVLDKGKNLIMKYTLDGKFIEGLDLPPDDERYFHWMTSFNVDSGDNLWFTTDSIDDTALRHVLVYDEAGFPKNDFSMTKIGDGLGFLSDIIPLEDGEYIVADSSLDMSSLYTGAIMLFTATEPSGQYSIYDTNKFKFYSPERISIVGSSMYVLTSNNLLLKLDKNYHVLKTWNLQ